MAVTLSEGQPVGYEQLTVSSSSIGLASIPEEE